ncbi:hypothetical protein [Eubacterium barkeri]|uniref:Uncharacterized protein n=1 Tax=Eubacterium barkeri TaxID=1528 RepID=A0A1H3BI05_EUBBA|nr:hypothetical protein [Eubacterium barkeri]SDX41537.1 hypothetical protein SAMN04488579_10287 [Eubacterium barkeri]
MKKNRKDITAGLSQLLERRLSGESVRFCREVEFFEPHCRVDFVGFKYMVNGTGSVGGAECGTASFYEVKSCMSDFKSGNGLTFDGDENWIVCPLDLGIEIVQTKPFAVGIYVPTPEGCTVKQFFESKNEYLGEVDGWSLKIYQRAMKRPRKRSVTEILAQMVYAGLCN